MDEKKKRLEEKKREGNWLEKSWHIKIRTDFFEIALIFLWFYSINFCLLWIDIYKKKINGVNSTDGIEDSDTNTKI